MRGLAFSIYICAHYVLHSQHLWVLSPMDKNTTSGHIPCALQNMNMRFIPGFIFGHGDFLGWDYHIPQCPIWINALPCLWYELLTIF